MAEVWSPILPESSPVPGSPLGLKLKTNADMAAAVDLSPQERIAEQADNTTPESKAELLQEMNRRDLAPGARTILAQNFRTTFGEEPPARQVSNRGTQIGAELKKEQWGPVYAGAQTGEPSKDEWSPIYQEPVKPTTKQEPGFFGKLLDAAKGGASQSLQDLISATSAITKTQSGLTQNAEEFAQPLTWGDLASPKTAILKATYQLAHGAPVLAGGMAGATAGELLAPESGPIGPIAGGVVGAAAMSAAQVLGPFYAEELKKNQDPNKAFDEAIKRAGTDGAFTAVGWAAFGLNPFKGAIKNLLFQAFGMQPAVGAAQRVTENIKEGNTPTEGVVEGYPSAVIGTILPLAGIHGARALAGMFKGKPGAEVPPPVQPPPNAPEAAPEATAGEPQKLLSAPVIPGEAARMPAPDEVRAQEAARTHAEGVYGARAAEEVRLGALEQARVDTKSGEQVTGERQRNATLYAAFGENAAVKNVIEHPELTGSLAEAMLRVAPMVEKIKGKAEVSRDITSDVVNAIDEIARVRAEGKTVSEVMAQGHAFEVSRETHDLMQFLDANLDKPEQLAGFMENYLQIVEDMGGTPSQVRGKAFDIIAEQRANRRKLEETAAYGAKEHKAAEQKFREEQAAREQNQAVRADTEMILAKAAGSGEQPEHKTAMELAFEQAAKAKELKGEFHEKQRARRAASIPAGEAKAETAGAGKNESPAKERAGQLPVTSEIGARNNAQPVGETGGEAGPVENVANRGKQIATEVKGKEPVEQPDLTKIYVKTKAIEAETGKTVEVRERADKALTGIDHQMSVMQALLECLG